MLKTKAISLSLFIALFTVALIGVFSVSATDYGDKNACTYTYSITIYNGNAVNAETHLAVFALEDGDTNFNYIFFKPSEIISVAPGATQTITISTQGPRVPESLIKTSYNTWENNYNYDGLSVTLIDSKLNWTCIDSSAAQGVDTVGVTGNLGSIERSFGWGDAKPGFIIRTITGQPALVLSPEFLASLPAQPDKNTLYATSDDGFIRFYVLETGEYQLNFGPDFEGKVRVIVFDKNFKITNRYEFK